MNFVIDFLAAKFPYSILSSQVKRDSSNDIEDSEEINEFIDSYLKNSEEDNNEDSEENLSEENEDEEQFETPYSAFYESLRPKRDIYEILLNNDDLRGSDDDEPDTDEKLDKVLKEIGKNFDHIYGKPAEDIAERIALKPDDFEGSRLKGRILILFCVLFVIA